MISNTIQLSLDQIQKCRRWPWWLWIIFCTVITYCIIFLTICIWFNKDLESFTYMLTILLFSILDFLQIVLFIACIIGYRRHRLVMVRMFTLCCLTVSVICFISK